MTLTALKTLFLIEIFIFLLISVRIHSTYYDNKILIWWDEVGEKTESFTLQFWNNKSTNPAMFSDQVIGSYIQLDEYKCSSNWSEISLYLEKIPATTNIIVDDINNENLNMTITEVKIPGNVTGILIPNTNKVIVRVLATITDNGVVLEQDNRFVQWKTIDWSLNNGMSKLRLSMIEARSVLVSWSSFGPNDNIKCICYKNVNEEDKIRGEKIICKNM